MEEKEVQAPSTFVTPYEHQVPQLSRLQSSNLFFTENSGVTPVGRQQHAVSLAGTLEDDESFSKSFRKRFSSHGSLFGNDHAALSTRESSIEVQGKIPRGVLATYARRRLVPSLEKMELGEFECWKNIGMHSATKVIDESITNWGNQRINDIWLHNRKPEHPTRAIQFTPCGTNLAVGEFNSIAVLPVEEVMVGSISERMYDNRIGSHVSNFKRDKGPAQAIARNENISNPVVSCVAMSPASLPLGSKTYKGVSRALSRQCQVSSILAIGYSNESACVRVLVRSIRLLREPKYPGVKVDSPRVLDSQSKPIPFFEQVDDTYTHTDGQEYPITFYKVKHKEGGAEYAWIHDFNRRDPGKPNLRKVSASDQADAKGWACVNFFKVTEKDGGGWWTSKHEKEIRFITIKMILDPEGVGEEPSTTREITHDHFVH